MLIKLAYLEDTFSRLNNLNKQLQEGILKVVTEYDKIIAIKMNIESRNRRITIGMMRYLSTLVQLKVITFTTSLLKIRITSSFISLHEKESFDEYMPEIATENVQWSRELSASSYYSNVQTLHKISNNSGVYLHCLMATLCAFIFSDYYNITYKSVKE